MPRCSAGPPVQPLSAITPVVSKVPVAGAWGSVIANDTFGDDRRRMFGTVSNLYTPTTEDQHINHPGHSPIVSFP